MKECTFCHRTEEQAGHKFYDAGGEIMCRDCGYEKPKVPEETEEIDLTPKKEAPINLVPFFSILEYVKEWRVIQITKQNVTTKFMANRDIATEILALQIGLENIKNKLVFGKDYEATVLLLDLSVHILAWFEAHPTTLIADAE